MDITILDAMKAESLLQGSVIFQQIEHMEKNLKYKSEGAEMSFDHFSQLLQTEFENLPRLKLEPQISPGTEQRYLTKLVNKLDMVVDECDRVHTKVMFFQAQVRSAIHQSKDLQAAFVIWYTLAATEYLDKTKVKMPVAQIRILGESEYSRLLKGVNVELESLMEILKVQSDSIKFHKKVAQEKYNMGKDQANALWTNNLPYDQGVTGDDEPLIEDETSPSNFVSKKRDQSIVRKNDARKWRVQGDGYPDICANCGDIEDHCSCCPKCAEFETECACEKEVPVISSRIEPVFDSPLNTQEAASRRSKVEVAKGRWLNWLNEVCGICREQQFITDSGPSCENGHGGCESLEAGFWKGAKVQVVPPSPQPDLVGVGQTLEEFFDDKEEARATVQSLGEMLVTKEDLNPVVVVKPDATVSVVDAPTVFPSTIFTKNFLEYPGVTHCVACKKHIKRNQQMVRVTENPDTWMHYTASECVKKVKKIEGPSHITKGDTIFEDLGFSAEEAAELRAKSDALRNTPDENCDTLANGDCVSEQPCMHDLADSANVPTYDNGFGILNEGMAIGVATNIKIPQGCCFTLPALRDMFISEKNGKRIFLLDAMSFIYRAYHATLHGRPMTTSAGLPTGATMVFINMINKLRKDYKPEFFAAVFDVGGQTFRDDQAAEMPSFLKNGKEVVYEGYKANREAMPEDLRKQIPYIVEALEAYQIPIYKMAGYEADDLLGTLAVKASHRGYEVWVVSGDKDMMQLVNDRVTVYNPQKDIIADPAKVEELFGVPPSKVIDVMALRGDTIDNVPGAPGIGEKGSSELIAQFGTLDELLANTDKVTRKNYRESLEANRDMVLLSRKLVTIDCNVPLEFDPEQLRCKEVNIEAARKLFEELEFKVLMKTLPPPPVVEKIPEPDITDLTEFFAEQRKKAQEQISLALDSNPAAAMAPRKERDDEIDPDKLESIFNSFDVAAQQEAVIVTKPAKKFLEEDPEEISNAV